MSSEASFRIISARPSLHFSPVTEPAPSADPSEPAFARSARFFPLALTLCLGVAISGAAFLFVQASEKQRVEKEFGWRARSHAEAVQVGVSRFGECLYLMRGSY